MKEEEKEKTIKKWEKTGLLQGLSGSQGEKIAQLMENQLQQTGLEIWGSNTTEQEFPSIFPAVMRVAARTIANDLVSVSPMDLPGWIFKTPLEKLEEKLKRLWEATSAHPLAERVPEIVNLQNQAKDLFREAIPGISEERISSAIASRSEAEKILKTGKLGNKFGI
jgi:hypothetical protein